MSKIKSYRDLDVWQRSVDLATRLYGMTQHFPQSETYGLTNQMRRAAVSIASNIAEGHVRSTLDYARFLTIAHGSLAELETQLEIARRIGFFSQDEYDNLFKETVIVGRQLNVLLKRLKG